MMSPIIFKPFDVCRTIDKATADATAGLIQQTFRTTPAVARPEPVLPF